MSILLLTDAKKQVRITTAAEDDLLQGKLDAAEAHVARFLNRNVYKTADELTAARAAVPAALTAAQSALTAASTAWWANPDECDAPAALAWEDARAQYSEAKAAARLAYRGIVINTPITHGILLLFGHLANNREAVLTDSGSKSLMLDLGFEAILGPWRVGEGV